MQPIRTERSNFTYKGPTPDIGDLPCRRDGGVVYSTWELTAEERIAIAEGSNIELGVSEMLAASGFVTIPPVSLAIDSTPRAV
jgi:hypothetical protein